MKLPKNAPGDNTWTVTSNFRGGLWDLEAAEEGGGGEGRGGEGLNVTMYHKYI